MSVAALVVVLLGAGLLAVAAVAAWIGSGVLLVPRPYGLMPEFEVLDYRDDRVTLPSPPSRAQFADTRRSGAYGLLWAGGHGRLGPVVADDGHRVVRPLEVVAGAPPRPGTPARLDNFVYRRDPLQDLGLPFEEVEVGSEVGPLAAWWLQGSTATGVLVAHGRRRGERSETLRALPAVAAHGRTVLVLAYSNHAGSPPSRDGLFHYGASEADDVLAGVDYLASRGVDRVALYGFSMGGAAVLEAVKRWPKDGPELIGLILDSPLIDPTAVTVRRVARAGVPLPRLWAAATLALASWRSGVRWASLDQRRTAHRIGVPVLLIAGTGDRTVPIDVVDEFAERVAGRLEYHRVRDAHHIEAWNRDPDAYRRWVREFLDAL